MAKKNGSSVPKTTDLKIRRLAIRNFKAIDSLEIAFPPPVMPVDPDVIALGSKNGLGKTSVLEACALLVLAATGALRAEELGGRLRSFDAPIDLWDILVRAGFPHASVDGDFEVAGVRAEFGIQLSRKRALTLTGSKKPFSVLLEDYPLPIDDFGERFLISLAGLNTEPLISPHLLYFHSYRKVREGNPELGMLVDVPRRFRPRRYPEIPVDTFKLEILRSMMTKADLFEHFRGQDSADVLDRLNELVLRYAGGKIEKLRPSPDNTIEFRVTPENQAVSYAFDGLSSGQKEIISTLFLIGRYSASTPGIVLVDEPELHLNVEWHRDFVKRLHEIAPRNQYIIATHSEDVFASVSSERRLLLTSEKNR